MIGGANDDLSLWPPGDTPRMLHIHAIGEYMRSKGYEHCSTDFLIPDAFEPDDNVEIIRLASEQSTARLAQIIHDREVDAIIGHDRD